MTTEQILEKKFEYCKVILLLESPFFGSLLFGMDKKIDDSKKLGIWSNGRTIFFNTDFIKEKPKELVATHILKQLLILCFKYKERGENKRDKKIRFSIASSYAVNNAVHNELMNDTDLHRFIEFNLDDFPIGEEIGDLSAEQIFNKIPDFDESDLGVLLETLNWDTDSEEFKQLGISKEMIDMAKPFMVNNVISERDLDDMVNMAYNSTKMIGKTPGFIDRYISGLRKPKINWKKYIKDAIQKIAIDWDFSERDRRFFHTNIILPSLNGSKSRVLIVYDTSGSMTEKELIISLSETFSIIKQFNNIEMDLVSFDTVMYDIETINTTSQLKRYKMKGGGGSDIRPVFEFLDKKRNYYDNIFIFTDGFLTYPEKPKQKNVLFILSGRDTLEPPFGKFIKIEK